MIPRYFSLLIVFSIVACSQDEGDVLQGGDSMGSWERLQELPTDGRVNAIAFSLSGKGYWGMGSGMASYLRDFWSYDPKSGSWARKKDFPFDLPAEAAVTVGNKAYVITYSGGLYEYDPAGDSWNALSAFPMGSRPGITGFSIGDKAYFGTGSDTNSRPQKDFWEYDPALNSWKAIADFPGMRRTDAVAFELDSKGYVGLGFDGLAAPPIYSDIWSYDPQTGTWSEIKSFPESNSLVGIVFSNNSKAYVGFPDDEALHSGIVYEYCPITDAWRNVTGFPHGNCLFTSSFAIDERIYVLGGWRFEYSRQIWQFIP